MTYLKKKVDGFDAEKDWDIVKSFLAALGLSMESKTKKQSIELVRPTDDGDLKVAMERLQTFFELDEKQSADSSWRRACSST